MNPSDDDTYGWLWAAVAGPVVALGLYWVVTRLALRSRAGGSVVSFRKQRSGTLLVGLCGSGKTTMFFKLKGQPQQLATHTSMKPNRSTMLNSDEVVTDYPGHRRLRGELYHALDAAKRVVIVVDSITIQDDRTEGAAAVADLLCDVLQCAAFDGVSEVLVACTKRDDVTSFSAKAIRRMIETEIAHQLETRSAAVGSIESVAGSKKSSLGTGALRPGDRSDKCALATRADGKFSFDDVPVPVTFADVAAVNGDANFTLDAVRSFIAGETASS